MAPNSTCSLPFRQQYCIGDFSGWTQDDCKLSEWRTLIR
jgi:hypothetical protein